MSTTSSKNRRETSLNESENSPHWQTDMFPIKTKLIMIETASNTSNFINDFDTFVTRTVIRVSTLLYFYEKLNLSVVNFLNPSAQFFNCFINDYQCHSWTVRSFIPLQKTRSRGRSTHKKQKFEGEF